MFEDKEKVFYRSEDYTVRMEKIDGIERYFIKFDMIDSPEREISLDVFKLYFVGEDTRKPLDKQRNERKRHIVDGIYEQLILPKKLTNYTAEDEDRAIIKYDIEAALKKCTPAQQKRFELYYIHGYTFEEIAQIEDCTKQAACISVKYVIKKIKKYFHEG